MGNILEVVGEWAPDPTPFDYEKEDIRRFLQPQERRPVLKLEFDYGDCEQHGTEVPLVPHEGICYKCYVAQLQVELLFTQREFERGLLKPTTPGWEYRSIAPTEPIIDKLDKPKAGSPVTSPLRERVGKGRKKE